MTTVYSTLSNILYILRNVWKTDKILIWFIIINTVVLAVSPFIYILFPRQIIDELLGEQRSEIMLILLLLFFLSSSFVSFFSNYIKGMFSPLPVKVAATYVMKIYEKCMKADFEYTEDPGFLDEMQAALLGSGRYDHTGINGLLQKLFVLPGTLIALLGFVSIVLSLNVFLLLYIIFNIVVNYLVATSQKKYEYSKKYEISKNERRADYIYSVMYNFKYGKEIRLYNTSAWLSEKFAFFRSKKRAIKQSIQCFCMKTNLINIALTFIREGIVYIYLVYMVVFNDMSIANFVMYVSAVAGFAGAFNAVATNLADIKGFSFQITDYRNFMARENLHDQAEIQIPIPPAPYDFEFRNVFFKYPRSENYIIENFNLRIPAGQKIAIVGHNGAGKTTFIKLLLRLYDVTDGEILCNGINIKKFNKEAYYRLFSTVFQEILPLAFSISDNISVSEAQYTDTRRVNKVLNQVGLESKVMSLKYGAETCVQKFIDDEGVDFSGGEQQKLMIARALYKNGSVMILDEPTAALDPLAEQEIYENFHVLTENKTSVYISHRLASTSFCDAIALFEKGTLAEYGTHHELMSIGGKYADMFNVQARYYRDDVCDRKE